MELNNENNEKNKASDRIYCTDYFVFLEIYDCISGGQICDRGCVSFHSRRGDCVCIQCADAFHRKQADPGKVERKI